MLRYWILLSKQPLRYRYLLFSLRAFLLLFFLILLLNPLVDLTKNEQKPQNISVIYDLSESMFKHFEHYSLQYNEVHEIIKSWGDKYDLNLNFFKLGRKIMNLDNIKFIDLNTYFMAIPDFISFEQPQQIILITDGKATSGKNINTIEFSKNHPIHTLGVGPIHTDQDIEIQDIILPNILDLGDTVNINIRINTRINTDIQSNFKIINVFHKQIYFERMFFEKGNHLKSITLKIPTDMINGLNVASIDPIKNEVQINNNTFSFIGNLENSVDNILMISGALSSNSRIIECLLDDIENAKIHHLFRMDRNRWNTEPLKQNYPNLNMIVMDDFPIYNEDSQVFQEIVALSKSQQIPIIYMQGPWGNLTSSEMIRSAYPHFVPKAVDSDVLMDISTQSLWLNTSAINLDQLPPQKRSVKWISDEKPWLSYIDESVLVGNQNIFYLVSLPALSESHFKISMNSYSVVTQLLQKVFLHAFHGSQGFLKLDVGRTSYNKGEIVQLSLNPVKGIHLKDFGVHTINGADTLQLECSEDGWDSGMRCSTSFLLPGKYTFYAEALLPSGEKVYSNTKSVVVQDVKVEMKELIQERHALMEISFNTGGTYASIDSLDTMLSHIDITPIQLVKKYKISSLSSQNYLWILIFLLSFEWYLRKKRGLL